MKKLVTKGDILVIILLTVFSLSTSIFTYSSGAITSQKLLVRIDSETKYYKMNGHKLIKFSNNGYSCVVEIEKNKARIKSSTCPKKICMLKGWISEPGNTVICLPMALSFEVMGIDKGNFDAVNN